MPTHVKITIEPGIRELFLKYWQEVKQMTTNLYIGDHVFNLESLVFGYKIYDQDLSLAKARCKILTNTGLDINIFFNLSLRTTN
jgi:hypothetical protein